MRISDWSSTCALPISFLRDLFELRMVVEPAAAAAAAARHTEDQARQMADALDAMATHGLATEQGRAADQRFHSLVIEAARNPLLSTLSSRAEERRVGQECVSTCRSRGLPYH